MSRDRVVVRGIRAQGRHGVLPEERRDGQVFVVDVALTVDLRPAAATDDLTATVDYAVVAAAVVEEIVGAPCNLIETLAGRIARRVLGDDRVAEVEVTVHKPQAPVGVPFDDVHVTVVRGRA